MNKNRHRIIFNVARGQRMVVAESARSVGAGSACAETPSPGEAMTELGDLDICKPSRLRNIALHPLTVSIGLALTLGLVFITAARAQIVADPHAPGNQRPTILQTTNGLPQINIQTPSAAGISRNKFVQFDVQSNGAVLNNSRTNTGTQLGGPIAANPWLATGEARVILNEVNSSHPSHLNGYVEVAGRRAEVIIANPAGIQVNGGGFINASGVTLTTGTPVMNSGHLDAFRVRGGTVRIEGLGLDTSAADYTAILARAMEVNASVWAKNLTVVTGTNDVKALASGAAAHVTRITGSGTEPRPNFMLDVAALGGMYAGKIYLVGTEAGLGINNQGSLIAQEGEWVLKADGSLINTGKVQAKGDLSIQTSGAISNTGPHALISSQGSATVSTDTTLSNTGKAQIAATETLSVNATGALNNTAGTLVANGAVHITAAGTNSTQGTIASTQATLTRAYNDGGWDGSITAGVEAGRLAVDIVGAATAVMGAGKVVATTAKAGAEVVAAAVAQTSTQMARGLAQFDRLVASGGLFAADGKPLMDFGKLTSAQKAVVGETLGAAKIDALVPGAEKLGRSPGIGQTGVDDLYKVNKPDVDYVVVEYKFGASALKQTADGLQMSDDWLTGASTNYNRVLESVGNQELRSRLAMH